MLIPKLFVLTLFLTFNTAQRPTQKALDLMEKTVKWDVLKQFETSPAFKLLKDYVPVAATVMSAIFFINDITKGPVNSTHQEVMYKLDAISSHLNKITESIEYLDNRFISEIARASVITGMEKFLKSYSEISKAEHQFYNILSSYATNETALLENLVKFLKKQEKAYHEFNLVDYLSLKIIGLSSPVDELINFGRNAEQGSFIPQSSTTKLIFDFHISLLTKVLRSFTIQELALELKFKLSGTHFNEDVSFLTNRKVETSEIFSRSLKASLVKMKDDDSKGYIDLRIGNIRGIVKFKNVLQTFFEKEDELSPKSLKKCVSFERVSFDGDKCKGEVRGCTLDLSEYDQDIIYLAATTAQTSSIKFISTWFFMRSTNF